MFYNQVLSVGGVRFAAVTLGRYLSTWVAVVHPLGVEHRATALGGHQFLLQDLNSRFLMEFV
jgi:hypothetical protein